MRDSILVLAIILNYYYTILYYLNMMIFCVNQRGKQYRQMQNVDYRIWNL